MYTFHNFTSMNFIKVVAITLLFLIVAPTITNVIATFYSVESEFVCCEKQAEEEKEENKSKEEIDDIEEYILTENKALSAQKNRPGPYTFRGKHFIDIVSDIITPPPEA